MVALLAHLRRPAGLLLIGLLLVGSLALGVIYLGTSVAPCCGPVDPEHVLSNGQNCPIAPDGAIPTDLQYPDGCFQD